MIFILSFSDSPIPFSFAVNTTPGTQSAPSALLSRPTAAPTPAEAAPIPAEAAPTPAEAAPTPAETAPPPTQPATALALPRLHFGSRSVKQGKYFLPIYPLIYIVSS